MKKARKIDITIDNLWKQMGALDAAYQLGANRLELIVEARGLASPEAAEASRELDRVAMEIARLDEVYEGYLRQGGWL